MEDLVAYFDGKFIKTSQIAIPAENLGFTRGYGAYECFRTYQREPFRLDDHLERLQNTCASLLIEYPHEDLKSIVDQLIKENPEDELIFRLYVTDALDEKPYQLVILCNTPASFEKTNPLGPLSLKTFIDKRESRGIKSTAYGYTMVSTKRAEALGFDTILLVGETGNIHELAKANFFTVKGNTLYTPKENLLFGITRKTILEIAKDYGYEVVEGNISLDSLKEMDEVFSCATIRGIVPIKKIDEMDFFSHKHAERLQTYFQNLSEQTCV